MFAFELSRLCKVPHRRGNSSAGWYRSMIRSRFEAKAAF